VIAIAICQKITSDVLHATKQKAETSSRRTTVDLGRSRKKASAKVVLTKKLTNGKKGIEMNTTHTKEPTEQKEKLKGGQLLETIDLRDYFAAKAMQGNLASMVEGQEFNPSMGAEWAYKVADAMLKEREAS
jgi:hypothetical protein